ncbi:MAG: hypothetical protein R3315_07030 [Woeseiaceae bacterium]|nr:hypothetical protein [Woeseiaceae bacterium]
MLQRTCQMLALGFALACTAQAGAESSNATTSWAAVQPTLATSAYPEKWRLRRGSYAQRAIYRPASGSAPARTPHPPAPRALTIAPVSALSVSGVRIGDGDTLLERLEAIRRSPIATLWRGHRRLLVLGFLEGGYIGVRLAESDGDE